MSRFEPGELVVCHMGGDPYNAKIGVYLEYDKGYELHMIYVPDTDLANGWSNPMTFEEHDKFLKHDEFVKEYYGQ